MNIPVRRSKRHDHLAAYDLTAVVCWTRISVGYPAAAQMAAGTTLGMATALV